MKTATEQLIELAERLRPTGEIGDGMVARFHDLARRARAEQSRVRSSLRALQENDPDEPIADNGATVLDAVRAEADAIYGECGRCAGRYGNDWSQCGGVCPVIGSPHFDQAEYGRFGDPLGRVVG